MNRFIKRLCCVTLAAVMTATAAASVATGEGQGTRLKEASVLSVDSEDSGYIRGIWGSITAGTLADEFEGSVEVRSGDRVLSPDDTVCSDDTVYLDGDSVPVLIYGDTSRDGAVNLTDVSLILKHIANWNVELCLEAADVSMNGMCDLSDVTALLKWIAGWDITLADSVFPPTDITLDSGFMIVLPDDADVFEQKAAEYLTTLIDDIYGKDLGYDRIIRDSDGAEKEIIIGDAARSRTTEAVSGLSEFSWTYSVPTDRTVVIAGNDSIATYEAVMAFAWDIFGYINDENIVDNYAVLEDGVYRDVTTSSTLTTGISRTFEYSPAEETLSLGGIDISEYSILSEYPDDAGTRLIHRAILRETGDDLDIVEYTGEDSFPAIRLGIGSESGESYDVSVNVFAIAHDGDDIVIDVADYSSLFSAAEAFVKWYIVERLPLENVRYGGIGSNLLIPESVTETVVSEGVTYSEIKYEDVRNQPVMAYLVTVENGADRIIMGTPDNGTAVSGVNATVMDAINAAEADGFDIAAGINADFFHIESDYSPQGLCVKDGVILKQNTETRPWIAVMKDGTLDCGIAGEARRKISNMQQGFGVSHIMMKKGFEYQIDVGSSFAEIRHPRTAMGYNSDGTVYLLVVDGRQPKESNGATLLDLMLMLKEHGADHAVNLDGGGSSTMIVDDGGFDVKNNPSDGALRKIFNSVLITK